MRSFKMCRSLKCALLLAISSTAIMFALSFKSLTMSSSPWVIPPHQDEGGLNNYRIVPAEQGTEDQSLCSNSTLKAVDILKVSQFKSRCQVTQLTSLPKGESKSLNRASLRSHLSHLLAKKANASSCNCPRTLSLSPFPLPKTALLSFPGSGNTWMRHLIHQLTGIYTGSIYLRPFRVGNFDVFAYEGMVNGVITVKTHTPPSRQGILEREYADGTYLKVRFDKLLIVVRNPFEALVAEFKRSRLHKGKVGNGVIDPKDLKWVNFVKIIYKNWGILLERALNTTLPYTVIFYEDLKTCLLPELVKIASFLRHKEFDDFAFCCTLKEQEGFFHRPPFQQTFKEIFTSEQKKVVNQMILKTSQNIKKLNSEIAKRILSYSTPLHN